MSNTQSPRLSVQWIDAAKAAHFHVSLNTLRPGLFRSPSSSGAGIVILVMEFMHEEEPATCPNHLNCLVRRAAVTSKNTRTSNIVNYNYNSLLHTKLQFLELAQLSVLTLKAPITTAAENKFCDIIPNFQKKIRYDVS